MQNAWSFGDAKVADLVNKTEAQWRTEKEADGFCSCANCWARHREYYGRGEFAKYRTHKNEKDLNAS